MKNSYVESLVEKSGEIKPNGVWPPFIIMSLSTHSFESINNNQNIEMKSDTHNRCVLFVPERVEQIHCFAIAVAAHDDMPNLVDHTAQFQCRRLAAEVLVLKVLRVRNQITGITHCRQEKKKIKFNFCAETPVGFILCLFIARRCKENNQQSRKLIVPTNMSPTCVSVNRVGIIRLSMHVKNTAFGWNESDRWGKQQTDEREWICAEK